MLLFGQLPALARPTASWPTYSIVGSLLTPTPTDQGGGGGAKRIGFYRIDETEEIDLMAFLSVFVQMQERPIEIKFTKYKF